MANKNFTMEAETKNFNKHIDQFMKKSNLKTDIILKKFAFDLLSRIIKKNPVDTGRSRAGWYVALNYLGGDESNFSQGSDPVAINEGKAKGAIIDNTKNRIVKWIEMVNGVKYIMMLEYGYSQQAPYGMVRLSMREISKKTLPKNMKEGFKKEWNSFY